MEAIIATKKGVKKGGKYIVPCEYDDIFPARVNGKESKELYITESDDLLGLVKVNPEAEETVILNNEYNKIGEFENDVAVIGIYSERHGFKYSLVDTDLNIKTKFEYDSISRISSEFFEVVKEGKHGIINKYGDVIVACEFSGISCYESAGKLEIKL